MADFHQRDAIPVSAGQPSPSVLHMLNASNRRLERLLDNLRNEADAESALRAIAGDVIAAVDLHADVALACIFLNQIAGTYAVRHCIETAVVAVVMSRRLGKTHADTLTVTAAALTMNVGMLRQQDSFQNRGSPLSREEMAIIHRHPEDSANLLQCAGVQDAEWISCVLLHHENDDGSGYPAGIASPEVTFNAKLVSLADRYCAQVSARNYRRSILPDQAVRNLFDDRDSPVDPELLRQFHEELGDFPPGCLVRLANGDIGVVSQRNADGAPHVHCLRDGSGALLAPAAIRRARGETHAIAAALSEDDAEIRFSMKQIWGAPATL